MRLTERNRELIPQTRRSISKGTMNRNDVGGLARVTRDEERVLQDEVMQI